ncbi:MAG TPA: DUF3499 family protein [Actinomycetota bacterium]|nr:DUF3499 family protein [Actinomycetota bacterium]
MRLCSKPGCHHPASSVLGYDYAGRLAILEDALEGDVSPHLYALCWSCADRLVTPRGWLLDDRRSEPPLFMGAQSSLA